MATWVINIVLSTGYFGILLLMFVENLFPPIPSEIIMPLAGYIAAQGKLSLFGIIVAGMAGSVLGALPLYYLGRKFGEDRLKEFADNHGRWLTLSRNDIERAKRWFDRHGGAAMFFCRLIPGVRSLISIPAGITGMKILPFLAYTATGTGIWAALLACLGYFLGTEYTQVSEYLDPLSWIVFGAAGMLYFVRVIGHKGRSKERASTSQRAGFW
jgi:membrane protein DedA with SNARE-associated domain